jgi:hypothetical protein
MPPGCGKDFLLKIKNTYVASIDPRCAYAVMKDEKIFVSFPLRNVGRGLAQVKGVKLPSFWGLRLKDGDNLTIRKPQVPAGETTRIDLAVDKGKDLWRLKERVANGECFPVEVSYSDRSGSQELRVCVRLSRGHDGQRYVNVLKHDRGRLARAYRAATRGGIIRR